MKLWVDAVVSLSSSGACGRAFDSTVVAEECLVAMLRGLVGDDACDDFRLKVRAFVPDGAHDEQLVGHLISDAFSEMR